MNTPKLPRKLELEILPKTKNEKRFLEPDGWTAEKKIRLLDPQNGTTWGFVVVDNSKRGPGLGGLRLAVDLTLSEVSRLARVMTLKNSAAQLPFGGGKSGLIFDPGLFRDNPGMKADLIGLYAEAVFPIEDYIPAPDMGTNEHDIQLIYEIFSKRLGHTHHLRGGGGRPEENGGIPIDDWGLTGHGLFAAAKTLESFERDKQIKNARVVVQGFGNVGSWTALKLEAAGAIIVGASDIHAGLWHPDGLDVHKLNSIRGEPCGLQGYPGPVEKRFSSHEVEWILEAPCDILVPAARPDAINAKNADRLQCRMILQGANTPSNKMTEYYLENHRTILSLSDFIVNVGGVIGCAVELKMTADGSYRQKVLARGARAYLEDRIFDTISRNVGEIYRRMRQNEPSDAIFRDEAIKLAEERLDSNETEYWL